VGTLEAKICPSCTGVVTIISPLCDHCGRDLHLDLYVIVPDGLQFGIAIEGEIRMHGLDLKRAQYLVSLLNSIK